jgi:hypothetical protein
MYGKLNMKKKILKMNAQYARNFSINRISMLYFLTEPPRGRQRAVRAICKLQLDPQKALGSSVF